MHGQASQVEIINILEGKLQGNQQLIMVNLQTGLSNLDWSADGNTIVVNSIGYELKFANVKDRKEMKVGDTREINWNTWTCPLG